MSSERRGKSHSRGNSVPLTPSDIKGLSKKWQVDDESEPILLARSIEEDAPELVLYSDKFIVIKPSAGKGFGVYAATNLPRGTRIIEEEPMLSLPGAGYGEKDIVSAFLKLDDVQQEKYMGLNFRYAGKECKIAAIFYTNCYGTGSEVSLFITCSRLNHACVPNSHVTWNEKIKRQTCQVIRDVSKGEEITFNYVSSGIEGVAKRQEFLRHYGFACGCEVCVPTTSYGRASETRREKIAALNTHIDTWWANIKPTTTPFEHALAEHVIRDLVRLLKEEGLVGPALSEAYNAGYECALKRNQRIEARKWALLELSVDTYTIGMDSPIAMETMDNVSKLLHPMQY
ncbi:set domain-containing protein 5 [Phlyctema vagabunda]|uniref:Set domain-containing protein 5 n=1 Tax=Phlyctema vagabunda TaxID=108571 RepID=A0ABR4PJ04_9HELO